MKIEEKETRKKENMEKMKEFQSNVDKLYDELDEKNLAGKDYDEIKKKIEDIFGKDSNFVSEIQKKTFYFMHCPMTDDSAIIKKPEWFDAEKFKKGQRFARDHLAVLFLGQIYGLICLLSHENGLETLIMTQKSHTPYLAFKRYLSTAQCIRNWYKEDPWCKDTQAHKDILKVKKMHLNARTKIAELEKKKFKAIDIIKSAYCPVFQLIIDDYSKTVHKDPCADYWYKKHLERINVSSRLRNITQMDMSYALFGFMGFPLLFPRHFGINENEEEDLENLCYVWRCIGYILGVDDRVNICSGNLKDVSNRCRTYVDELLKPSLRRLNPQWEHMSRCFIEGNRYFFLMPSFEILILQLAELLDLQMPTLYSSMTYFQRMKYYIHKYIFNYITKYRFIQNLLNLFLNRALDKALHFDDPKIAELKIKSMLSPLHVSIDN